MAKRKAAEPDYGAMLAGAIEARKEADRRLDECKAAAPQLVRGLRKDMGLTLREMGDRWGVSFTYLSKIENGRLSAGLPLLTSLYGVWKEYRASKAKGG
jgi:DNA-binding transcriptional regulator YiaG